MIRPALALTAAVALLAGCTGDMSGLLSSALEQAKKQAGTPSAAASTKPGASPAPAASASPAATPAPSPAASPATTGATGAVTAALTVDGQAATVKQTAKARFTTVPTGMPNSPSLHSVTYEIGDKAMDGGFLLIVGMMAAKPLSSPDLSRADLQGFTVNLVRTGGAIISTQRILTMLDIPKADITVTPVGGKLDIKASLTGFGGIGTVKAADFDIKGLPTS